MALKQEIEEIRESVKAHDRQIDGLIRAFQSEHETVRALSATLDPLAASVIAHDRQLEELARFVDKNSRQIESLERHLQAYLRRLPPQ